MIFRRIYVRRLVHAAVVQRYTHSAGGRVAVGLVEGHRARDQKPAEIFRRCRHGPGCAAGSGSGVPLGKRPASGHARSRAGNQ